MTLPIPPALFVGLVLLPLIPGEPYISATDPDGYTVELWYELPTPFDPARPRRRRKR